MKWYKICTFSSIKYGRQNEPNFIIIESGFKHIILNSKAHHSLHPFVPNAAPVSPDIYVWPKIYKITHQQYVF